MAEKETYEISVVCRNCGYVPGMVDDDTQIYESVPNKRFSIPKGTEVKDFLRGMTCEHCGCEGYMGLLDQPG